MIKFHVGDLVVIKQKERTSITNLYRTSLFTPEHKQLGIYAGSGGLLEVTAVSEGLLIVTGLNHQGSLHLEKHRFELVKMLEEPDIMALL